MKLDTRVLFVWWFCITIVVYRFKSLLGLSVITFSIILMWIILGKIKMLYSFLKKLAPFLIFLSLIKIGEPQEIPFLLQRMFVIIGSSFLVLSQGNSSFVNAIRNLKSEKLSFLNVPIELVAYLLGQGLQTMPQVARVLSQVQEIQKARGVDQGGSVINRTINAANLAMPLFSRWHDVSRQTGIAVTVLDHELFRERSIYNKLQFGVKDWMMLMIVLSLFVLTFTVNL